MKVTVEKKKKSVVVVDFGHAPFLLIEKPNRRKIYIPDGFTVECFCFHKIFIGQTSVQNESVQYQFFLKSDPTKTSGWQKSPSGALKTVNERIKNRFYIDGSNGALVIGVTYPNLQTEIVKRFGKQLEMKVSEEEINCKLEDGNARMPAFLTVNGSPFQEPPPFIDLFGRMDGLEPISLGPISDNGDHADQVTCGSLDSAGKTMNRWFCCDNSLAKPAAVDDFMPSSFEETDFFIYSNDPLDFNS